MRVLMFGWEFPPHISGGLGTACYGLTRGLAEFDDVDVTFVVPKARGDEDQSDMILIGANTVSFSRKEIHFGNLSKKMTYYEAGAEIVPYVDPEMFWKLKRAEQSVQRRYIKTNAEGKLDFTGRYGLNLMDEIYRYALVAEIIAGNQEFDLIHAHDWLTYPAGMAAKRISGRPLVIHVHATDFDRSGGQVNPKVFEIEKQGMEAADHIITVSNLTRDIVVNRYGVDPAKVTTVYNAVEPPSAEEKRKFTKGVDGKIVTFLGRITLQKGPEYYIEAARLVLNKMKNVRFVMAGSGDMMYTMVRRVAALGMADRFHFTGFLQGDDVYEMFRMSDVFVMPSVSEPFGIVPLEAMQSGVPVIISYQSGVSEILNYAMKIDYWDTHAMADAIYALLNYPAIRNMFVTYGKKEVENLRWKNSAKKVRDIYLRFAK